MKFETFSLSVTKQIYITNFLLKKALFFGISSHESIVWPPILCENVARRWQRDQQTLENSSQFPLQLGKRKKHAQEQIPLHLFLLQPDQGERLWCFR